MGDRHGASRSEAIRRGLSGKRRDGGGRGGIHHVSGWDRGMNSRRLVEDVSRRPRRVPHGGFRTRPDFSATTPEVRERHGETLRPRFPASIPRRRETPEGRGFPRPDPARGVHRRSFGADSFRAHSFVVFSDRLELVPRHPRGSDTRRGGNGIPGSDRLRGRFP